MRNSPNNIIGGKNTYVLPSHACSVRIPLYSSAIKMTALLKTNAQNAENWKRHLLNNPHMKENGLRLYNLYGWRWNFIRDRW